LAIPGLGYALVVALPGTFFGVIWSLVVRRAGWPGALLSRALLAARVRPLVVFGLLVSVAGQLYTALVFTALLVQATRHHMAGIQGVGRWLSWTVAFLVSLVPSLVGVFDWGRDPTRVVQHRGAKIVVPLLAAGFALFLLRPDLMQLGWGWVPVF
jgi:hypothetical protein